MNGQIAAVIFDLDGTLVDSEPNYFKAERRLLAEFGIEDFDEEMKRQYIGMGTQEILGDLRRKLGIKESVRVLAQRKNDYYLELARQQTEVFPEMRLLLELLHQRNQLMAVASGSSFPVIEAVLEVADLARYFSVAVSADSVPRGKPAPDLFLETARRLGVRPENCVVVEDARYGVTAARRAGMRCIAIPYLVEEPVSAEFLTADLLFPGGMGSFSAKLAFDWITGSPEAVTPNAP